MTLLDSRLLMVVFDLDDTIYPEYEYRLSGVRAVAQFIHNLYDIEIGPALLEIASSKKTDFLDEACRLAGLPNTAKESLLWVYRLHVPLLQLDSSVSDLIARLHRNTVPLAMITDGRAVSQRLKIRALGLDGIKAYISEECGSVKPDPSRYEQVMIDYPGRQYIYVADNPYKDFSAPRRLGWDTFQLKHQKYFIHDQVSTDMLLLPGEIEIPDLASLSKHILWEHL
jgi:putative hydrolase of the HAD superfamily